ncbi:Rne/Rng family ribonuclease [Nocardioides marmoriginsengisoli]|uniref:Ribonuclease E n=1 Tax=Nocardioides marmoriginsengisoli TaxID=661483 RepID=A0A3N0CLJ6_9ACTN|nr:Rne/Rng family ribonuclease [Nocardioides marmoriginsengisoli]RNL63783.1 Rne/Rng family ribonuclease [Nocardioides marmoriginsengisoli]
MLDVETPDENTSTTAESAPVSAPENSPENSAESTTEAPVAKKAAKKATAKKAAKKTTAKKAAKKAAAPAESADAEAGPEAGPEAGSGADEAPKAPARKRAAKKAAAKPAAATEVAAESTSETAEEPAATAAAPMVLFQVPEKAPARKRAAKKAAAKPAAEATDANESADAPVTDAPAADAETTDGEAPKAPARKRAAKKAPAKKAAAAKGADDSEEPAEDAAEEPTETTPDAEGDETESGEGGPRRRRRRGGRRRRRGADAEGSDGDEQDDDAKDGSGKDDSGDAPTRRTRTRERKPRNPEDEITSIGGSTRLEAKKQRRREGREAGRRRAPIVSEAEFLARREAVERVMVIRQRKDLTQIAVIEDKVLVEHYVARESQTSLIGNIYLGRVQNVLPSMEAAFIDIGKGRNAVLYAGEVNWGALGHKDGQPRKVESVLKSGQTILVQVTKDPVGHKGARLTGQISLPGRFLVYVPDGNTSGISRKLPDTERNRLKTLLKEIVPDTAGVIVRTAAEGASEEELTQDVERLTARWADIEKKVAAGKSPDLLYGEPDLTLKVVRDLFTEDFAKLVVQGDDAWKLVEGYVKDVAPDLAERLEKYEAADGKDVFASYRIDEQINKGLDRKVWLPSGGSLVIDRTEAMTVVDVNTGKFTGSGGNLEETVTKNNLEAAEEMVRQLRLRDIGGIIVIDFIDMVLESNRDLVLRRLVECLGRDRTRHQVAEVTSLGLVQMTRKRIGTGLIEAFSEDCDHCKGRGIIVHEEPIEPSNRSVGMGGGMGGGGDEPRGGRRNRGGRGRNRGAEEAAPPAEPSVPSPMALAGSKPHTEDELAQVAGVVEDAVVESTEATESTEGTETVAETAPATTRRRSSRRAGAPKAEAAPADEAPAEAAAADETPADETPAADATPKGAADEPEVEAEPAAEPVVEAPAPVVVTTTRRRRAAGRPAGPAVTDTAVPEVEVPEVEAPAAEQEVPVEETPEVASEETPDDAEGDAIEDDAADGDAAPVFHVPVKKKGSRKR